MKIKHLYLLNFVVLVVMGGVGIYFLVRAALQSPHFLPRRPVALGALGEQPSPEMLADIQLLEGELDLLARPKAGKSTNVSLRAFGYEEVRKSVGIAKGRQLHLRPRRKHTVSFAFVGDGKGFCVIDGSFYPQGASLPEGERILKVLPHKVLIEKGKIRSWFPVEAGEERRQNKQKVPGEGK